MLCSVPIHLHTMQEYTSVVGTLQNVDPQEIDNIWQSITLQVVDLLCADNVCGDFAAYALSNTCNSTHWNYMHLIISPSISKLFQLFFPSSPYSFLLDFKAATIKVGFRGMDAMYIPYHCVTVVDWTLAMIDIINKLIEFSTFF